MVRPVETVKCVHDGQPRDVIGGRNEHQMVRIRVGIDKRSRRSLSDFTF